MVTRTGPAGLRIEPGTPMRKVVPPRLVGPYLNGQRAIIAGFVYRARDVAFRDPGECFAALGLGYDGSEFTADVREIYFLAWPAREMDTYVVVDGMAVTEVYTDPMPIPVGASISRLTTRGDDLVARYDGLVWRRPTREA
jgi:hypothetical protein